MAFVPPDFEVPLCLDRPEFRLEPLGSGHNESDHAAWTSSIAFIRTLPGFRDGAWPPVGGMSLDENLADLEQHAQEFAERSRFAYTVLQHGQVIGCVYIDPKPYFGQTARVKSWVSSDHADLDGLLHIEISSWLAEAWPFHQVHYRPQAVLERRLVSFEVKERSRAFRITVDGRPVKMTLTETETIVGNLGSSTRRLRPASPVDWLSSPKTPLPGWPDDSWIKVRPHDRTVRVDVPLPSAYGNGTALWRRERFTLTFAETYTHVDIVWDHWSDIST